MKKLVPDRALPRLNILFSLTGKVLPPKSSTLFDEDDGIDEIMSQIGNDVLLSQVNSDKTGKVEPKSTMEISSKRKGNELSKILEVINLQKCNVTININWICLFLPSNNLKVSEKSLPKRRKKMI